MDVNRASKRAGRVVPLKRYPTCLSQIKPHVHISDVFPSFQPHLLLVSSP